MFVSHRSCLADSAPATPISYLPKSNQPTPLSLDLGAKLVEWSGTVFVLFGMSAFVVGILIVLVGVGATLAEKDSFARHLHEDGDGGDGTVIQLPGHKPPHEATPFPLPPEMLHRAGAQLDPEVSPTGP